jgi:hypothetical protein
MVAGIDGSAAELDARTGPVAVIPAAAVGG